MFTKITEKEASQLSVGDILIRYPMHGEPVDNFDITKRDELTIMKVGRVFEDDIDLLFGVPDEPIFVGLMQVSMGALHKTKTEIIDEKRWWLYIK
jgi:hypothetical protein